MNTDDLHDFLHPRRGPAPLTPSDLAEQLAADHPQLSIQPDVPLLGGMGAVYRATLTTSAGPRPVAIKVLHWHLMDDPAFTARFQREQALLSTLNHENIVKLHDTGHTAEGLPFLVMDWIEGRSLTEFTQPGSTTDRQFLLRIAADLCAATHYAHEIEYKDAQGVPHKGILHRDLKPQNIIVTAAGRAVVLDFGIARPLTPGHTLTQPGDAPGTHGYIAPEVLAGEKPDARADIYSLGIIIYQLLMKKLPDVFAARPSEHSLDPRFDDIVMKAAASEREKRYKTAGELKRALELIPTMNMNPANAPASAEKTAPNVTDDEYPTPDPASITIEFGETTLVVNGLDFSLDTTIEDWMQLLGRYSESELPEPTIPIIVSYFWHHLGVAVTTVYSLTDTVYIAPLSPDEFVTQAQKQLFRESGNHRLSPFKGTLRINGATLKTPISLNALQANDRRFESACQDEKSNKPYYGLAHWDRKGRICKWIGGYLDDRDYLFGGDHGFGNRSDFVHGLRDVCQSASLHAWDHGILEARNCEGLFWVAQAVVRDSHDDQCGNSDLCLLSFTRLLVNQGNRYGSCNSLYSKPTGLPIVGNERVLLRLKGFDSLPNPWLGRGTAIYSKELSITTQHIRVVGDQTTTYRIKDMNDPPWVKRVRPITFTGFIGRFAVGLIITAVFSAIAIAALHWGLVLTQESWQTLATSVNFKDTLILCGGAALCLLGSVSGLAALILPFEAWGEMLVRRFSLDGFWEFRFTTSKGKISVRLPSSSIGSTYHVDVPLSVGQIWLEKHREAAPQRNILNTTSGIEDEFGYIALFYHIWGRLKSEPLIRFPGEPAPTAFSSVGRDATNNQSLLPCRTCGKEVAKSARACPHCGENLRSGQKPSGWRQKACSNCGEAMARFAQKCQQPDCGHPNTWLKVQSFAATLAVLGTCLWSFLHFQQHLMVGLALPLMATTAALGWRGTLFLLKSFYGH